MKKFISNLLSLVLAFALLGSNIVSATYVIDNTLNDGLISSVLTKNDDLTNKIFEKKENGYFTKNGINQISLLINNNIKSVNISGDLSANLVGEYDTINYNGQQGFVGVFEGTLEDGTFITLDVTYTESNVFAILSAGYLGDENYENAFFGEIANSTIEINEVNTQNYLSNLNETININDQNYIEPRIQSRTVHQGGINLTSVNGAGLLGELNIYFADEMEDAGLIDIYAKLNTNCTGVQTYLANYDYSVAQSIYSVKADKFYIKVRTNYAGLSINYNNYEPEAYEDETTIIIPIVYKSGGVWTVDTITGTVLVESITVTKSNSTSNSTKDIISWEIYKNGGWPASTFEGNENSQKGMGAQVEYKLRASLTEEDQIPLTAEGKIRYSALITVDDEPNIQIHYTTPPRNITRHVTALPNN